MKIFKNKSILKLIHTYLVYSPYMTSCFCNFTVLSNLGYLLVLLMTLTTNVINKPIIYCDSPESYKFNIENSGHYFTETTGNRPYLLLFLLLIVILIVALMYNRFQYKSLRFSLFLVLSLFTYLSTIALIYYFYPDYRLTVKLGCVLYILPAAYVINYFYSKSNFNWTNNLIKAITWRKSIPAILIILIMVTLRFIIIGWNVVEVSDFIILGLSAWALKLGITDIIQDFITAFDLENKINKLLNGNKITMNSSNPNQGGGTVPTAGPSAPGPIAPAPAPAQHLFPTNNLPHPNYAALGIDAQVGPGNTLIVNDPTGVTSRPFDHNNSQPYSTTLQKALEEYSRTNSHIGKSRPLLDAPGEAWFLEWVRWEARQPNPKVRILNFDGTYNNRCQENTGPVRRALARLP